MDRCNLEGYDVIRDVYTVAMKFWSGRITA